jgi:acid-sensing ion channel 5
MKTLKQEIIDLNKETLEGSSIHAIPNITRNKYILIKIMWLICFFISFGVCTWLIKNSIDDFLNYDVITTTEIKYYNKMQFPIVSLCNLNLFATNIAKEYINNLNLTKVDVGAKFLAKIMSKQLPKKNLFSYKLEEIMLDCFFNMNQCNLSKDFELYYDSNYGNCFRFNTSDKYAYRSGQMSSINMEIWIGNLTQADDDLSFENGYTIFISNGSVDSNIAEGIKISPGYATNIALTRSFVSKQPKPYSECTANLNRINSYDSECYIRLVQSNRTYRFSDCSMMCFQKFLGIFK